MSGSPWLFWCLSGFLEWILELRFLLRFKTFFFQLKFYLLPITKFLRYWFAFLTFNLFPIQATHLAQSTGKLSHYPVQTVLLLHMWCKTTVWAHSHSQSAPAFTCVIQTGAGPSAAECEASGVLVPVFELMQDALGFAFYWKTCTVFNIIFV